MIYQSKLQEHQHLIAGTLAGVMATVALYPLELVKTRMQVVESTKSPYSSLAKSFTTVVAREGYLGFYQGLFPAAIAAGGSWGGYFYFYEASKKRIQSNRTNKNKLDVIDHLYAGTEAGVFLVFLFNPLWLVKTRLALQGSVPGGKRYTGFIDALVTITREEGFIGLYKGVVPALLLTSHGAIQFATYEKLKEYFSLNEKSNDQSSTVSAFAGGVSKIVASTITYPYQVIKSRLQQRSHTVAHIISSVESGGSGVSSSSSACSVSSSAGGGGGGGGGYPVVNGVGHGVTTDKIEPRYKGTWDCAVKIWRREGALGFFRGVIPNALKVAPSAAITFVVYEETLKLLR